MLSLITLKANVELLYAEDRHLTGAQYNVVAGEITPTSATLPFYQAAVMKSDAHFAGPVMLGPVEATLYAAYRGLFRCTMQDVGKRLQQFNRAKTEERPRIRTISEEIDRMSCTKSFRVLGIDK